MLGGLLEEMNGGDFGHGMLSAGLSKVIGLGIADLKVGDSMKIVLQGIAGGVLAEASGGDFANGAASFAIQFAFNQVMQAAEDLSTSDEALEVLSSYEAPPDSSFRDGLYYPYNDGANHATIGYGHLIHTGPLNGQEPAGFLDGITSAEALQILADDVAVAEVGVSNAINVDLSQNQFDALVLFAFNTGNAALGWHGLSSYINDGYPEMAPEIMALTNTSAGVVMEGLNARRRTEGLIWSNAIYERQ
jgi:lysozyme